jgi:competence ComEA-like helix-hairpin-helix protein
MNLYTSRERKGLTVLLLITALLLLFNYLTPFLYRPKPVDYSALFASLEYPKMDIRKSTEDANKFVEIAPFDVNAITAEGLQEMGLSKSVAKAWINYRNALGEFKRIEELEKVYGLERHWLETNRAHLLFKKVKVDPNIADQTDHKAAGLNDESIVSLQKYKNRGGTIYRKEELAYLAGTDDSSLFQLESAVEIESEFLPPLLVSDTFSTKKFAEETEIERENVKIDINDSNEYQWQQIKGVGPFYARSIVKYRNLLGGFSEIEQVAETYNLPDSVFQAIRPFLISSPVVKKMPINTISVDSLRLHPYLNWKQASIMVNYRNNHGPFKEIADFYKIRVFDSTFVKKIEPYIVF